MALAASLRSGRPVAAALGLAGGAGDFVVWRDLADGLEYLAPFDMLAQDGLELPLGGYGRAVLLDFRVLSGSDSLPLQRLHSLIGRRGVNDVLAAARKLSWQSARRSVRLVLQGKAVRVPVRFPGGEEATAGDVLAVAMQRRRLQSLAKHEPAAVSGMWNALGHEDRFRLRVHGTGAFEAVSDDLLQQPAPALPWAADWWSLPPFRSEVAGTDPAGEFDLDRFRAIAARQTLAHALARLGPGADAASIARAARFEWERLSRAARLSGGNLDLPLAALDGPRGESGPGRARPQRDGSGGQDRA